MTNAGVLGALLTAATRTRARTVLARSCGCRLALDQGACETAHDTTVGGRGSGVLTG